MTGRTLEFDEHSDAPRTAEIDDGWRRSPSRWLAAGTLTTVLGAILALAEPVALHIVGWGLASIATAPLVALFRREARQRRFTSGVAPAASTQRYAWALLIVGFAIAVINAWLAARHYAHFSR